MRAATVESPGAKWEVREVPTPSPGPGEVLVRVRACGLCHNDVLLTRGDFPFPTFTPVIVGHEAVGEVTALGPGVTDRRIGDRVGVPWVQSGCGRCAYCARGLPLTGQTAMMCAAPRASGITVQGGHAEYVTATAGATVPLPDDLSYEYAAPVLCAAYTAWSALRDAAPEPRDRVAIVGLGGIGHLALQYSLASGFETVVVTSSPDKLESARELGAHEVVSDGAALRTAGGADVIVATTASHWQAQDALQGLNDNGTMVLPGIDPARTFDLGLGSMFWAQRQRIVGSTHGGPHHLAEALNMVARGQVTPLIEVFPSHKVAEAVERLEQGKVRFRAVITY